ncbi:uncharacterized protein LOC141657586 isoform X2 [Silene latifolia]|uniref:uncharacterized protein LOC141657586 isoform X2 n=1 Tax=Silene latifolia TaxID=37657 RepID=UPI003D77183E
MEVAKEGILDIIFHGTAFVVVVISRLHVLLQYWNQFLSFSDCCKNRCAEKLHYKRDREQAEIRQKEEVNRNRELTGIEDDMGDEQRKSIDRKRTDSGMEREDSRGRREKKIKSREGK